MIIYNILSCNFIPLFFVLHATYTFVIKSTTMEDLPLRIRIHLFNLAKYLDKKLFSDSEYEQRRIERIKKAFPRFCPQCHFPVDQENCPVCSTPSVTPLYCSNCDITVNSRACPLCGQRIYHRKIKSGIKIKDHTVFPN